MTRGSGPASPFPLGATLDGEGTNFSLFSENAERVELCLFDDGGNEERVELRERTAFNWHGYVPGVGPGQCYAYRVHGHLGARARATASTRASCCSTRTRRRSRARSAYDAATRCRTCRTATTPISTATTSTTRT